MGHVTQALANQPNLFFLFLEISLFIFSMLCGLQDLVPRFLDSLVLRFLENQTLSPCSGSADSLTPKLQGGPLTSPILFCDCVDVSSVDP